MGLARGITHRRGTLTAVWLVPMMAMSLTVRTQETGFASSPRIGLPNVGQTPEVQEQPPPELREHVRSLEDFTKEGEITSYLGMVLRQGHSGVDRGEVRGLMVVSVIQGSAAAQAGLESLHDGAHWVLVGAGFAATMVFPPALIGMALAGTTQIGESFDLLIGVDSVRIVTLADFTDCMRDVRGGEIVYLSIVRDRRRLLIPVRVPSS